MLKKIDRVADALNADRSKAIRWVLERGLDSGYAIGLRRSGKGRSLAGEIAAGVMAQRKASWAAEHAASAAPAEKAQAEIKALRVAEDVQGRFGRIADKLALPKGTKATRPASDRAPPTTTENRHPRAMTAAEIKAAADRAEARRDRK